ncbi:MAG: hypothetical protein ABFD08_10075 [Syntrophomonas sp.]
MESGFLSDVDISQVLNKDIVICGYCEKNLTDIGYNLTPTEFVFSTNKGMLVPIYNSGNQKFCWVDPNDTVLILTREAVWVSEAISGTFHSKVKLVSQGFGHISTTLDALWEGPLLISLNNPTKRKIRFVIGEDKGNGFEYCSFVTLIFYRMVTPTNKKHDNPPCRIDILKDSVRVPRRWFPGIKLEQYLKLNNIVNKIRDFEDIVVDIGKSEKDTNERGEKIKEFKSKYLHFEKQLSFNIDEAHEINKNIIYSIIVKKYIFNTLVALCVIGLLGSAGYAVKNSQSNILSLIAIITTIFIWGVNRLYNLFGFENWRR